MGSMNCQINLPDWVIEETKRLPDFMPDIQQRMRAVIRFSELNFENETGGPFAAGILEKQTGKLITMGVNRVVPMNMSCLLYTSPSPRDATLSRMPSSA